MGSSLNPRHEPNSPDLGDPKPANFYGAIMALARLWAFVAGDSHPI